MEIKSLINKLHHHPSNSQPRSFLALYLNDDILQLAIWQVAHRQTTLLQTSRSISWDGHSEKSLIQAVNQAFTALTQTLPSPLVDQLNQIIFGVPFSWIDQAGNLLSDKKQLLKSLCRQLDLRPLGFALILESLLLYLQDQEGNPVNALVLQVSDLDLYLSLVQQGKIIATQSTSRTDDFVADFTQLLQSLTPSLSPASHLPNRILLFNGHHDLTELAQLLNAQEWQAQFPFLHLPQIEALEPNIGIRAIALAGGAEIAKSLGLEVDSSLSISTSLEELGFSLDHETPSPSSPSPSTSSPTSPQSPSPSPLSSFSLKPVLTRFLSLLPRPSLSHFSFPNWRFSSRFLLFFIPLLLSLLALVGFFWFVPQAQLTLYLKPKTFQTNLNLIANPHLSSPNLDKRLLPATTFSQELESEKTIPTSGEGLVGDKAQGEVTIYNRTSLPKTFPAGTTLSANRLKFTLVDEVTVASKSTAADYTETPGKAKAKIIAVDIGEDYNLPANTEFQVAHFSSQSFIAKNNQPITGGTARKVRQVSQKDQDQLFQDLLETMKQQLQSQTKTHDPNKLLILPQDSFQIISQSYSADVGQEADQLTLKLKLKLQGLQLNKQDILTLATTQLKNSLPPGFYPLNDSLDFQINSQQPQPDDSLKLDLSLKLNLLPNIDLTALRQALRGQPVSQLSSYLHSHLDNFVQSKLKLQPSWLPPRLQKLPFNPQRIHLSIQPS